MNTNLIKGLSLEYDYLAGMPQKAISRLWHEKAGPATALLEALREEGLASVELRGLHPLLPGEAFDACLSLLAARGLGATVHGYLPEVFPATTLFEAYPWLKSWPREQRMVMALHACSGGAGASLPGLARRTVEALSWLGGELAREGFTFQLALELNRQKGATDPGADPAGLLAMLETADPARVGICWDMGHGYANQRSGLDQARVWSTRPFLERVIHTHLHALDRESGGTHDFLSRGEIPFSDYAGLLCGAGYGGVWNLELKPDPALSGVEVVDWLRRDLRVLERGVVL